MQKAPEPIEISFWNNIIMKIIRWILLIPSAAALCLIWMFAYGLTVIVYGVLSNGFGLAVASIGYVLVSIVVLTATYFLTKLLFMVPPNKKIGGIIIVFIHSKILISQGVSVMFKGTADNIVKTLMFVHLMGFGLIILWLTLDKFINKEQK